MTDECEPFPWNEAFIAKMDGPFPIQEITIDPAKCVHIECSDFGLMSVVAPGQPMVTMSADEVDGLSLVDVLRLASQRVAESN